jgi:uncharacterized membrane protein YtjA (UPF0391 family)
MTSWAITFLAVAMIAAVLGLSGIAGAATNVAWYCAGICLALAIAIGIFGRKPPE